MFRSPSALAQTPTAPGSKLARCSFTRNTPRRFVLRIGPSKACSRRYPAFFAGSHRPRLEAESWVAALEHRHSLRSRTALGAIKCTLTARDIVAVRGGVENQSRRTGPYQSSPEPRIPASVGPFSYFDSRATVTQSVFDWKSINATRAASQNVKSAEYSYKDARDLVVLAVGFVYLQAIADEARIETSEAQVKTAQALFDQATDQVNSGTSPAIDALRAKVELQTRQQQLIQARNNFAIQKLTVARVIGLAPGQEFELTDKSPYQPIESITVDEAVKRAYDSRSDYKGAMADVRAAQFSRRAATAGYLPSLSFNADYGVGGAHPSTATQVFDVRGTLTIPIFQGGSVHGDVLQADARLEQSRERLDNLRAQIDCRCSHCVAESAIVRRTGQCRAQQC